MDTPPAFLPIIQLSITPVILLSGMGALMLTLTNRMGRVVDRTRNLAGQVRQTAGDERAHLENQLTILWRRAKLVRLSVTLAAASMLTACLLVIAIFADAALELQLAGSLVALFVTSILLVVAALVAFLRDIFLSLTALGLEVQKARAGASSS